MVLNESVNQSKREKEKKPKGSQLVVLAALAGAALILVGAFVVVTMLNIQKPGAGMPNPIVEVTSLSEADALTGFASRAPRSLPFTLTNTHYAVIANQTLQVTYQYGEDSTLQYRMSSQDADVSGDYNSYTVNEDKIINDMNVTLKGNAPESFVTAVWRDGTYSYSITADEPRGTEAFASIIGSIA